MLHNLPALLRRRLSVSQRFALLSFLCVLAITVLVCATASLVLQRQLVKHDGAVIGDLASLLFTSIVPAEFFAEPTGTAPMHAERLKEFAQSKHVIRFLVYDADRRVLWSDDASVIGRRFGEHPEVEATLRGDTSAGIIHPGTEHHSELNAFPRLQEVYTPVRYQSNEPIVGAIELYRAPPALFAALDRGVLIVWILGGAAGMLLYLTLVSVARSCSREQVRLEAKLAGYARALEVQVDERTRDLAEKAKSLSILYAVSSALGCSLETREILARALDELVDGKAFDSGWIRLLPDENDGAPLVIRRGICDEIVQRFAARLDAVARSAQACVIALEETPDGQPGASGECKGGLVLVPIGVGGRSLGTLAVAGPGIDRFTPDDTLLLSSVGRQIGIAVGNAKLYAETREREHEARILYDTTGRFGDLTDGDALLKAIVKGAVTLTQASYGGIGFPDGDDMVGHRLVPHEQRAVVRLNMAECLSGLAFTSGVPQVANDAANDSRVNRASVRSLGVRNLACVPLQHRGRAIGVLFVGNKEVGAFTGQDVVRLRAFAHHATVALENARLLRETKSAKEYLENLIASSVDAIVTLDSLGRITFVSKGGQRMFGCAEGEMIGRPVRTLWVCGPRDFRTFRTRLVRSGRVENYETDLAIGNGVRLSVSISASFLRDTAGEVSGILAVVKDVTSLRRLHEQIVRSERLAAAGLLAAGVAHELGNPLTCISSLAQILMARTSDGAVRRDLEHIEVHAGRIGRIVQDFTRLTRPAPATLRKVSVQDLLDTAVNLARHNPAARRMRVDRAVDPDLPLVRVAPDHLVQVFLNLILNAADAGGKLTIRAVVAGDMVQVIFEDSGCGMTTEQMRRLFEAFHSTKDNETHLGLGLFVSHEIIRQHGGDLLVESQPGLGATLTVVLPAEPLPQLSEELV